MHTLADALRGLRRHEFASFPDLAAWSRSRIPPQAQVRFAMGHGAAFVAMIDFMRRNPRADITLLAFSSITADGNGERLRYALASLRHLPETTLQVPVNAVLLYADTR